MLLDSGPDAVDYLPQVVVEGEYGEDVVGFGDPIPLRVELQRLSSDEAAAITSRAGVTAGGPVRVMYRFTTRRDLPTGAEGARRGPRPTLGGRRGADRAGPLPSHPTQPRGHPRALPGGLTWSATSACTRRWR